MSARRSDSESRRPLASSAGKKSRPPRPVRSKTASGDKIRVRAVTRDDWTMIERLFGPRGACGGCWCMYWRLPRGGNLWEQNKGEPNRRAFEQLVRSGHVHGCLAFSGDEPCGWCCIGPRGDFPRLERSRVLQTDWSPTTWSVVCFYVPARFRHLGIGAKLLAGAVRVAREQGAREVEGYPVRPKRGPGAEIPAAFAWTGVESMFESQGFSPLPSRSPARTVYRREVKATAR